MNSLNGYVFRCQVAVVSAVLVFAIGLRIANAVDTDRPAADQPVANGTDKVPADQATIEAPAQSPPPQLQLQDDGPSAQDSDSDRLSRPRMAAVDDMDERPLWKHWIFWAATGALVVGAVSLAVYAASGTDSSLAPCPPDVVVSLGCFGAGR